VDADGDAPAVRVPGTTVDALVAARGWDGLDLLKIDVEGGEPGAFAGMAGLLAGGARPAIVFECNATTLPHAGASVVSLRATLLNLGYELLMIDHLHPGKLRAVVEARAVQPEAVTDYVAVTGRPPRLEREWAIEPPLTLEETVIRVDRGARDVDRGYRRYAADLLAEGPAWLRDHPAVAATRSLLTADDEAAVRDAFAPRERPGPGAEHADADAPAPLGLALYAASVSLPDGARGVERARGQEGGELLHAGIDVHLARGHVLAVRGDGPAPTTLLRVLAGLEQPAAGHVERGGTALLVGAAGDGLEPELSVAENVGVFTAFAGGDIAAASGRAADIAGAAGLEGRLDDLLAELGPDAPVRLALVVALTEALPDVLLLDALPAFREPFATWARKAAAAFVAGGGAIVQAGDPLLVPADATLELDRPPVPA
jgi:ABC-type polysaccharide/polyol phosphate transport system ATPase subunit